MREGGLCDSCGGVRKDMVWKKKVPVRTKSGVYRQISRVMRTSRCLDCPGVPDRADEVSGSSKNHDCKGVGAVQESKKQDGVQEFQEQEKSAQEFSSNLPSKSENVMCVDSAARNVTDG